MAHRVGYQVVAGVENQRGRGVSFDTGRVQLHLLVLVRQVRPAQSAAYLFSHAGLTPAVVTLPYRVRLAEMLR